MAPSGPAPACRDSACSPSGKLRVDKQLYYLHNTVNVYESLSTQSEVSLSMKESGNAQPHPPLFHNRDPVYLQVVRHFRVDIATGKLQAGQTIPSRRELASLFNINPNTAQKAYKEMEDQGLIVTEGNSPSKVTSDERILGTVRGELIAESVEAFVASVRQIGVPVDELLRIVKAKYESALSGERRGQP